MSNIDMDQLAYLIGYWESVARIDGHNVMAAAQCLRELEQLRQSPEPSALRARLECCELSLHTFDPAGTSEYWLRYQKPHYSETKRGGE